MALLLFTYTATAQQIEVGCKNCEKYKKQIEDLSKILTQVSEQLENNGFGTQLLGKNIKGARDNALGINPTDTTQVTQ